MVIATQEDRAMIREAARGFLADAATGANTRRWMASDLGYDPAIWARVAGELGWPGVPVAEDYGGLGLGLAETALLMEEMGAAVFCSPFFATVCLAGAAIRLAGDPVQQAEILPAIASGELTATLVASQGSVGLDYRRDGDVYVLNGVQRFVIDGASADLLVVAARLSGSEAVTLFAVPGDLPGIARKPLPTLDQTRRQAEIVFTDLRLSADRLLGAEGESAPVLARVFDEAVTSLAAEQAGGARRCLELTVDYIKERVQFGRPIGSFQAIKHRCADMMVQVESALAAARAAADAADAGDSDFPLLASMAKAYCSDAYFACAGEAIQLHGGVGFTWDYEPHLFFKRARASAEMLGNANYHRERVAAGLGL
jgi:alkylation response protein AidB-like acyl-CoA dehydrogenase